MTMLFILVALCGLFCMVCSQKTKSDSNFFIACDADQNKVLTRREVQKCSKKNPEFTNLMAIIEREGADLVSLLDTNGDDDISVDEYVKFLEKRKARQQGTDGQFTVTTRDGEVKQMSRDELQGKMSDSFNGMTMKNDKMYKEDVTVGKVDEIAQKSPEMGRFMQLGRWIHTMLISHNHTSNSTTIAKMKTLPRGGSESVNKGIDEDASGDIAIMSFSSNFTAWLLITLDDKSVGETKLFELKIEYNPNVYRRPYIAILDAWSVTVHQYESTTVIERVQELVFPPPRYQIETFIDRIRFLINGMIRKHGFLTVSAVFVTIISSSVGLIVYGCCVHEYKTHSDHDKTE